MEALKKQRRQPRRGATTTINAVDAEFAKPNPSEVFLSVSKQKLEEIQDLLEDLDEKILEAMRAANATDVEEDTEYDASQEYRDNIRTAIAKINSSIQPADPPPSNHSSPRSMHSAFSRVNGGGQRNFKLPKIELQKFNGELKDWLGFWSQFQKIDEDEDLHASDKFQYLVQAMLPNTEAWELVNSYPASAANYPLAVDALKERFGRESLLLQVYIRELLQLVIVNVTQRDKLPLDRMYIKLESHLRALSSLNLATADPATWLFPLVESSLPIDTLRAWQRSPLSKRDGRAENPPKNCLDFLMEFLKSEVQSEQQIALAQNGFQYSHGKQKGGKKNFPSRPEEKSQVEEPATVAGLYVGEKKCCLFCDKSHDTEKCGKAHSMTLDEKTEELKNKKGCLVCFKIGHFASRCKSFIKCVICGKKHNVIMCPDLPRHQKNKNKQENPGNSKSVNSAEKVNNNFCGSSTVLLGTFRAKLVNGDKRLEVRALYDPGAQRSYISQGAAEKLSLQPISEKAISHSLFGGVQTEAQRLKLFHVQIENRIGKGTTQISVLEKQKLCGDIPRLPSGPWLKEIKKNKIFISDMASDGNEDIELLVGADIYGKMLTGRIHQVDKELTAIETKLGWVILGSYDSLGKRDSNIAATVINMYFAEDASLEQLWSLEAIGIQDQGEHKTKAEKSAEVKEHFARTVERTPDGRYTVRLPWMDGQKRVSTNRSISEARLLKATAKLKGANQFTAYGKLFDAWQDEGIVEYLTEPVEQECSNCHYLPHRPVFKPTSLTTPVRPVFDASCKSNRSPSLNDCLEKGPNMLELIPSILHKFRERRIGVVSDIRKAFQMIWIHEDDRDFLRFLWWEDPETSKLRIIRHCRVVFGVNCSPFLLAAVLEHHLESIQDDRMPTAKKLLKSLYVDNCVTSVDTPEEYDDFRSVSIQILAEAKMELRQWESSIGEGSGVGLLTSRKCGLEPANEKIPQELTSVLGYKWDRMEDTISLDVVQKIKELPEKLTKRIILSRVQQIFDPLGFVCPALLPPKVILQQAWEFTTAANEMKKENTWDVELPRDLQEKFRDWYQEVLMLRKVQIPRCVNRNFKSEEIHIFADASSYAYATAAFLRVQSEEGISIQLLQAKSRVAPLKKLSVPRLELMACTISARLLAATREAIDIKNIPTFLWTDSSTALAWIRRSDAWGTFVGNRVKEILSLTEVEDWRHIPGIYNPADLPSRGCSPKELSTSKWWEGPEWLYLPREEWPSEESCVDEVAVHQEKKKSAVVLSITSSSVPWYIKRYSCFSSNLRVFAWISRYVAKLQKKSNVRGELTVAEIERAERTMAKLVQQEAFPNKEKITNVCGIKVDRDEEGLLFIKTKLQNREDVPAFKFPVLLPSEHPFVEQIIQECHKKNRHAGVQFILNQLREKYWILQGRRRIRKIVSKCVKCRRFSLKAPCVPDAPLPEDRIKEAKTFQITGVDLAGPLYLRKGTKSWIVLFTCAIYRAVHLEMVTSLTTDAFLLALHRFVSRRGRPERIYSDNGTNFVGANNLFSTLDWKRIERDTRVHRIQWRFQPPSGPWWGGFFERLIRSVKDLLKKSLGHKKLNEVQLETCLCEVEAIINGRPLTYVTEDPEDLISLTPAMFLQDIQTCDFPEEECLQSDGLVKRYRSLGKLKEELRSRFRSEYLALLVHRGKSRKPEEFRVGDVVLVGSDNKKRQEWPLVRIEELIPGSDGKCRVARVRTATGHLIRPLQRLFPLEVSLPQTLPTIPKVNDEESKSNKVDDQVTVKRSRYGRVIRPTDFFKS